MRVSNAFALRLTVHRPEQRTAALLDEVDRFSKLPGAHRAFVRTLRGLATPVGLKDLQEFADDARKLSAKTLVVWGDKDKIFPVGQSNRAMELLPDASLSIMRNVGHFPQIDAPIPFAELVHRFLARPDSD